MNWQNCQDEKEKYQLYLCSREWSEKKNAVMRRAGRVCERCLCNLADHVHHLTYVRKYRELIEDLQAICRPCHEFIHGKSDHDPKMINVYLAGKVRGKKWELVKGLTDLGCRWIASDEDTRNIDPHMICAHDCESDKHGIVSDSDLSSWVYDNFVEKICQCKVVIGYFDCATCFGTIAEVAFASAKGIPSLLLFNYEFDEEGTFDDAYWFVRSLPKVHRWHVGGLEEGRETIREYMNSLREVMSVALR